MDLQHSFLHIVIFFFVKRTVVTKSKEKDVEKQTKTSPIPKAYRNGEVFYLSRSKDSP